MPIPVEVSAVGFRHTERQLHRLGARTVVRLGADGSRFQTDGGNAILDCQFAAIDDPVRLDARLHTIVGLFRNRIVHRPLRRS